MLSCGAATVDADPDASDSMLGHENLQRWL